MMFRAALVSILASLAVASKVITPPESGSIASDSPLGQKLIEKARVVVPSTRELEQNQDAQFVARYWIKYLGCSSLIQINREGNEDEGLLYNQQLVRFALCPDEGCKSCSGGGEYVVNMMEFVDAYTEAKLQEKEWQCEMIRENCYCDNANDDEVCENQCYIDAGMDECVEYEGQEEFEIQRYLECAEMEGGNNNGNNNNGNYYYNGDGNQYYGDLFIGPYCSPADGKSIYLGVFYDQGCTNLGDLDLYATRNYGIDLPYSSTPIVENGECLSCMQVDENNGNNNNNQNNQYYNNNNNNYYYYNQDMEPTELCQQAYEMAAKCETDMDISYPDTTGCEYINNILPQLDAASKNVVHGKSVSSGGGGTSAALAVLFALTTVLFGAYAYFLYRKIKRGAGGSSLIHNETGGMS